MAATLWSQCRAAETLAQTGRTLDDPAMSKPGDAEEPHYHGHRERLRTRFREGGGAALADYELLELILFQAIPRRDVKPLAKQLIQRFGSFAGVVGASRAALEDTGGLGDSAVDALKAAHEAAIRLTREDAQARPVFGSGQAVIDYCRARLAHSAVEEFHLLFLDRKNGLIAAEAQAKGTVDHTPVYPREVVKRALELAASAIILVHNHPSGDPSPSKADIEMTREVARAAGALGIAVHDHLIIGRSGHASLKSLGLM
jgi:DNA repair protein RadC